MYGSNFFACQQRGVLWNCLGSINVVADVLVKDTFGPGGIVNSFEKFIAKMILREFYKFMFVLEIAGIQFLF